MSQQSPTQAIDLNDYELIPEVVRHTGSISIRPDGQVSLNDRLLAEVHQHTDSLQFQFMVHRQDKHRLLLFFSDTPNYSFPTSGSKKDREFSKHLVEHGVPLPARYNMVWSDALNGWIGELVGSLTNNALKTSLQSRRRAKK